MLHGKSFDVEAACAVERGPVLRRDWCARFDASISVVVPLYLELTRRTYRGKLLRTCTGKMGGRFGAFGGVMCGHCGDWADSHDVFTHLCPGSPREVARGAFHPMAAAVCGKCATRKMQSVERERILRGRRCSKWLETDCRWPHSVFLEGVLLLPAFDAARVLDPWKTDTLSGELDTLRSLWQEMLL